MEKNEMENLSNEKLLLISGGGLSEVTTWLLDRISYAVGRIAAYEGIPAHGSALLGPNARPIM